MNDATLGQFVIVAGVSISLIVITLFSTAVGLSIASVGFALAGAGIWAVAKGGIHEATGSILLVGAAICAGFAAISRDLHRREAARRPPVPKSTKPET